MRILNILTIAVVLFVSLPSLQAQAQGKEYDWQKCMENARNNRVHDISLLSYEPIGSVKDLGGEDAVFKMILADTMYTVRINISSKTSEDKAQNRFSDFTIIRFVDLFYGNMNYVLQNPLYYASEFRQYVVDKIKRHDLDGAILLKTLWSHRGNRYNSLALVSEREGVLYDNIGSYIIISEKEDSKNSEPTYDNKELVMQYKSNIMGSATDIFGQEAYHYELSYLRKFDSFNNFVGIEKGLDSRARSIWECDPRYEDNVVEQAIGKVDDVYMRVRIANPTSVHSVMVGGSHSRERKTGTTKIDQ